MFSITASNQDFSKLKKPANTDKRLPSDGVVPSIASTNQLFKDVVNVVEPVQKVFSDVAELALKIRIEQVTFVNACKTLLVAAAENRQDVDNMIVDHGHPIWRDTITHRNLDTMMARFLHLCLAALERFKEILNELKSGLYAMRAQGTKKVTSRCRLWLDKSNPPTLGTTEKFPKLVQDLRGYNDIFCTLIWQAVPRRSGHQSNPLLSENPGYPPSLKAAREPYRHVDCIQRASQDLYNTLSNVWRCHEHQAHSLSIALNLNYAKNGTEVQPEDFRFNVAVTSSCFKSTYRLIVESTHDDLCMYQTVRDDLSLKGAPGNKVDGQAALAQSSEPSQLESDTAVHLEDRTFIGAESLLRGVPNVASEDDLCCWLRNAAVNNAPEQETECPCVGFIETRDGRSVLFSSVVRDVYQNQWSHSLDDVLVRANMERRRIPLEDRLRTALFLGNGVLHLSASSWLCRAWSSKDIHFFETNDHQRCTLGQPFLSIESNNDALSDHVCDTIRPAATRSCLLSLGLVLIELAFSAPWRRLQLEEDLTGDLLEQERNILNLTHLSNIVSRELGSRYAKVVQTCLFLGLETNQAEDLGKAKLDEIIFESIVRELDRCLSAVTF